MEFTLIMFGVFCFGIACNIVSPEPLFCGGPITVLGLLGVVISILMKFAY